MSLTELPPQSAFAADGRATGFPPAKAAPPGSPRHSDTAFYNLLAGGAGTKVLEAFLDLGLPELLGSEGPLEAGAICDRLAIDRHRGWKFLHLLAMSGLLTEESGSRGRDEARFSLSDSSRVWFGEDGTGGYFKRDLVQYWRNVAGLPVIDVLRGMPLPEAVRWPPPGLEQAEHLETWMRVTADGAIATLVGSGTLDNVESLLDVGGGDGTIGCALAERYPTLDVTVFNLPASAYIARRTISESPHAGRVRVHEGDFLEGELPQGFERILFSRVLTDWTADVCVMLFEKVRRALAPCGRLLINEALVDGNESYALSWEYRYLFYDTFGRAMFKPLAVYEELLRDAGFEITSVTPMRDDAFYSVVEATPIA